MAAGLSGATTPVQRHDNRFRGAFDDWFWHAAPLQLTTQPPLPATPHRTNRLANGNSGARRPGIPAWLALALAVAGAPKNRAGLGLPYGRPATTLPPRLLLEVFGAEAVCNGDGHGEPGNDPKKTHGHEPKRLEVLLEATSPG